MYTCTINRKRKNMFLPLILLFILLPGLRIMAQDCKKTSLALDSLPLQLNSNAGEEVMYTFDKTLTGVHSRNLDVVTFIINGNQLKVQGNRPGRTGLKITAEGQDYYVGYRVNHTDGSMPGMPDYLSVASVSEDSEADLAFWKDIQPGLKNKAMDIRYIYLNGGPFFGWTTWGINRPETFATESLKHGLIPFFVFYNIPDTMETYPIDSAHVNDPTYMTAYFNNLNLFLIKAHSILQGELFGIILEPDFLGYIKQNGHVSSPDQFITCVAADTIAPGAGNVKTLVERINQTIDQKKQQGYNIIFGWQLNLWPTPVAGVNNVIRATDAMGYTLGRKAIQSSSEQTTLFGIQAGMLTHNASFISLDKYGLDAGSTDTLDPADATWFFNNDHWHNYLLFANTIFKSSGFPVVLWQLPIGRINSTTTVSAYTNQPFPPLSNTTSHYEDSTPDFFLGDTFIAEDTLRISYFGQNLYQDPTLGAHGDTIIWGSHMNAAAQSGVICAMFGAGVGASTSGIGNPPTDSYFWVQKVQEYYLNGAIPIEWDFFNDCYGQDTCYPHISISYPIDGEQMIKSEPETVGISLVAFSSTADLQYVKLTVDGNTVELDPSGYAHSYTWTPPGFGSFTIIGHTSDGTYTAHDTCTFTFLKFEPATCGLPLWNKDTAYTKPGHMVSWDGNIYRNDWWTQGEKPGAGAPSDNPWKYQGPCPATLGTPEMPGVPDNRTEAVVYPNPVHNKICHVLIRNSSAGTKWGLQLTDNTGRNVTRYREYQGNTQDLSIVVHLPDLPRGIYFLKMVSDHQIMIKKLVLSE